MAGDYFSCNAPECYGHLLFDTSSNKAPPQGVRLIHLYQDAVTIGRADCTVTLDSTELPLMLSRKHAIINRVTGPANTGVVAEIKDVSTNGSSVNGARIDPSHPHALKDGDIIVFGSAASDVVYIFREVQQQNTGGGGGGGVVATTTAPNSVTATEAKNAWASSEIIALTPKRAVVTKPTTTTPKPTNTITGTLKPTTTTTTITGTQTKKITASATPTVTYPPSTSPGDSINTNNNTVKHEEENDEEELKFNSSFSFHGGHKRKREDEDGSNEPTQTTLTTIHPQLYQIGEEVEAKCHKATVPEYNAWFEAVIINFDPENNLYSIRFKGYSEHYNEVLPVGRIRCPSDGDWDWATLEVSSLIIVQHNGWWYDALVVKKLANPNPKTKAKRGNAKKAPSQPCLLVKLVDLNGLEKKCMYDDVFLPVTRSIN